jgi:hypothetical protein
MTPNNRTIEIGLKTRVKRRLKIILKKKDKKKKTRQDE